MKSDEDLTARVRSFNRTVTQRVGALSDSYLARDRPLGASRVLWEIGPGGTDARALRARLDLDSGYLSRLLRGLQDEGLIQVVPAEGDHRVRTAVLTDAGRAERAELDRLSDDLAAALLAPLNDRQRDQLAAAMGTVERLLTAGLVTFAVTDPASPEARACMAAYFAELGKALATPTYAREGLRAGNAIAGPALIEEHASTTVLLPGDRLRVDAFGNLVIEVARRSA